MCVIYRKVVLAGGKVQEARLQLSKTPSSSEEEQIDRRGWSQNTEGVNLYQDADRALEFWGLCLRRQNLPEQRKQD